MCRFVHNASRHVRVRPFLWVEGAHAGADASAVDERVDGAMPERLDEVQRRLDLVSVGHVGWCELGTDRLGNRFACTRQQQSKQRGGARGRVWGRAEYV